LESALFDVLGCGGLRIDWVKQEVEGMICRMKIVINLEAYVKG